MQAPEVTYLTRPPLCLQWQSTCGTFAKHSTVTIVTELQATQTKSCGLIPGSGKRFYTCPNLMAGCEPYPIVLFSG